MNNQIRTRHVLILLAAGAGAFVLARGLSVREGGAPIAEAAERAVAEVAAVQPATEASSPTETAETAKTVKTEQALSLRPVFGAGVAEDPFQKLSWLPPPIIAAPAPTTPPPAPRAPPLPFTFIGFLEKGAPRPSAFLAKGEDLIVASAGDVLDRNYRVESMTATEIVFTYLPLNERQTIALAGGPK
jgi:hypothetical protein